MAKFSLREAAKQAGKSKSTIFRAIKAGRLSAAKTDNSGFAIDASELFRVYPRSESAVAAERSTQQGAGQDATARETAIRMAELETELRMLRELLAEVRESRDDLRAERDDWRARAERLLTDQRPKGRPTSTSAPRPPAAPSEPRSGDVVETSIQSGMAEIRRHLENLRAKGGH